MADALIAGLRDMIRGGRLTHADIPDDWRWLMEQLDGGPYEARPPVEIPALLAADVRVDVAMTELRNRPREIEDALCAAAGYLLGQGMPASAAACWLAAGDLLHLRWRRDDLLESNNRYLEQVREARGQVGEFRALLDRLITHHVSSPHVVLDRTVADEVEALQTIRARVFGARLVVDRAAVDAETA